MRAIVLAAGQGSRMLPLTEKTPKPLLPVAGKSALGRILTQLIERNVVDISVVVGHSHQQVVGFIKATYGERVRIVENTHYKEDINILSLSLAVGHDKSPFVVFESDCVFDDQSVDAILGGHCARQSSWFTVGSFLPSQNGGILRSASDGKVEDIRIVPKFEEKYISYRKLIGALRVGEIEAPIYLRYLHAAVAESVKQYYLTPWIKNLMDLPCIDTDLSMFLNGAYNSPEDYNQVRSLFE